MELIFLTTNDRKFAEMKTLLPEVDLIQIEPEFEEIQGSPLEIVTDKVTKAFKQVDRPVIVDDTNLVFEAWKYLPGPYINDFMQSVNHTGLFDMLRSFEDKNAEAIAYIGYKDSDCTEIFKGVLHGTIVEPRGTVSFGWDPIFLPEGCNETFAEMGTTGKNEISHRRDAVRQLKEFLLEKTLI